MDNSWKDTIVQMSKPVRMAAAAALGMLALFLLVLIIGEFKGWMHDTNYPARTITVTGQGKATAIPDTATISFGVTVTAADVATAEKQMTDKINTALASVKDAGISSDDITTSAFNISPHYENTPCGPNGFCPNGGSRVNGYDVTETVQVKVKDTTKVAAVLGGLAKANVSSVTGPDFVVGNPQMVEAQARAQAIENAHTDAVALAKQLGVHLGEVVGYSDDSNGSMGMGYKTSAVANEAMMPPALPTIPVGQNEYAKSVSVTYEIN